MAAQQVSEAVQPARRETAQSEGTKRVEGEKRVGTKERPPLESPYRLVTLPGMPSVERELVSLLRAADETVTALTLTSSDSLVGESVESLPVFVFAIERSGDGDRAVSIALPTGEECLDAGDTVYALGRPEALRRLSRRTAVDDSSPAVSASDRRPRWRRR